MHYVILPAAKLNERPS